MQLERNTANAFIEYLIKHGYPQKSIALEWGNETHRIDIAILDESQSLPVAIYEIKGENNYNSFKTGVKQLKRYQEYLGYSVKAGLVFGIDHEPYFEYYDITEYSQNENKDYVSNKFNNYSNYNMNEPYNYKNLSSTIKHKAEQNNKDRKKKKIHIFNKICWFVVCPFIFGLLLLNTLNIYRFTFERLIVLLAFIVTFLLPFFNEIKFGDFSIKRYFKKDNDIESKK